MKKKHIPHKQATRAMEVFRPQPNMLYTLEMAAHLAGVPRRALLIYCRAGVVQPVCLPPYGAMAFTEEAIRTVRSSERMRNVHGVNVAWIKTMFDLLGEVARLREEVRFLSNR